MNQEDAKKLIVDFFHRNGFCHAFVERQVATIESFPGKFKLEFSALQGRPRLVLEIYVYRKEYDQSALQECLAGGWKPDNWEREDDKKNFGRDNGVVVRFILPFEWRDSSSYDWDGLLNGYWAIRNRLLPCLVQSGSVQELFVAWICEQKSQKVSLWSSREEDLRNRQTFSERFKLNPFDCLKLLSGKNVFANNKSTNAFDAVADFEKLYLKKDSFGQDNPEEAELNETYLALFKEFCREYVGGGKTHEQWAELRGKYVAEIARMRNSQYIIRAFEHTENKDFENYVVLGVWHRLRTLIKGNLPRPVTQQFVKHEDGRRSFMDLYFPCVNIQVECDEGHHKSNIAGDKKREKNIEETLVAIADFEHSVLGVDYSRNVEPLRVDATLPLDDIDRRLDEIAGEIAKKYGGLSEGEKQNDWKKLSPVECVRSRRALDVSDGLVFAGRDDVLAALQILQTSTSKKDSVKTEDGCSIDWQAAPALDARDGACRKGVVFVKIDCLQGVQGLALKDMVEHVPFEYCQVFVRYRDAIGVDGYRFAGVYGKNGLCARSIKVFGITNK